MEEASERTPLTGSYGAPMYVFTSSSGRLYRHRIRQFQCCICGGILAMFVLGVVIAVSYSINSDFEDRNGTIPNSSDNTLEEQLQVLLTATWPISDSEEPGDVWPQPGPSQAEMEAALEAGRAAALARRTLEAEMPDLAVDSPSYRHQLAVATGARANALAEAGYSMVVATKELVKGMGKTPKGRGPRVVSDWQADDACVEEDGVDAGGFPACPASRSPWRSLDGRCNNAAHPWWGAAFRPFRRVLPASYADGVNAPRAAADGGPLPSAREVSVTVHRPQYRDDASFSVLLAVWGQFIDHDITATALSKKSTDGKPISCCQAVYSKMQKSHPECFPVMLGKDDPYFQQYNLTCMEFVRSAPAPECRFGPREQMNQASNFLDGSVVYGTTEETAKALRLTAGGRLRMLVTTDNRELLPESTDLSDGCNRVEEAAKGRYCFTSGDARANENLHLTTMHLLLARQHNRLAAELEKRNSGWDDERLYQEARRIVAAQMQHVTFNEFVPIILGRNLTDKLALRPRKEGYATDYDPNADPRVANVFAAAAFRFAHTLLPGLFRMISNTSSEYIELHKVLFNPFVLYVAGGEEATLRGALGPGLLRFDPHFSPQVSEHLFERSPSAPPSAYAPKRRSFGLDLVSLNIQRGRDHGLPAYPAWRAHCGFPRPSTFDDLKGIVDEESFAIITTIYKSVDDIDAYSGMLAEIPVPGGMLGPTLTCIIADQFVRLRRGDRYWFETGEKPQAFTPEQLTEVRKTSLAQLICDTSDAVNSIQQWVLRAAGPDNPRVLCATLPRPNLDAWVDPSGGGPAPVASFARVKVGAGSGGSAHPRAYGKPPLQPPDTTLDAGTPILRPLRLGAAVRSGRITSAAERAWYVSFPLELKLPLFDSIAGGVPSKAGAAVSAAGAPPAYAHGILWEGSVSSTSPGFLSLSGQFSMPKYTHGDALTNFSIEWLNGDFEFQLQVFWNTSDISAINFQGSYSSPVYLGVTKKYTRLQKESPNTIFDVDGEFRTLPSLDIDPLVKTAPVILLGTYSPDRTSFLWSGNVSVVIPDVVPVTPWSKSSYWSDANADIPLEHLPWVPRKPEVEALPATAGASSALGISVSTGSVTVESNGSDVTWWDGQLPVAIPMPAFSRVVKAASQKAGKTEKEKSKPSFASGVVWDASLKRQDNVTLRLQGNFTVPIFVHGPGALFAIEWKTGKFSFDFELLWNSTLDGVFQEGYNYSSPVFFRAKKANDTTTDLIADLQGPGSVEGSAELQFVAASSADAAGAPKAPIILHGSFTPDKINFLWFGNATVILPAPTGPVLLQMAAVTPSMVEKSQVAIGAEVIGGSITAGAAGSSSSTLWNGVLPVPITRPDILARGISWKGELTQTKLTEAQLDGTFSTTIPADGGATYPIALFQGEFSLQLSLLWNVSVDGLLPLGTTVYSPIYLRGAAAPDDAEAWFSVDEDPNHQTSDRLKETGVTGSLRVPIILQGAYSADLTTFWWSGRVILTFPATPPLATATAHKGKEKLILTKSGASENSNTPIDDSFIVTDDKKGLPFFRPLRLGLTVKTALVTTSSGTAWAGGLPLQLPLPLFDFIAGPGDSAPSVSPPVYTHGIVWDGTLSTYYSDYLTFSGKFSLPRYIHGRGLKNFTIQWINGEFGFGLNVLWNSSDTSNLNIQGTYSSPVYLGVRQKYSHLQDVPADILSDATDGIQLTPSVGVGPLLKKAPIILLGTYSPDKTSFLWSGNVSVIIPDAVPVPIWAANNYWEKIDGAYPPELMSAMSQVPEVEALAAIPATSSALGVSVSGGNVTVLANGSYVTWWNGTLPLSIPSSPFNRVVKAASKGGKGDKGKSGSFASGLVWDAVLEKQDNITLRLKGNFSLPIFVHGPGALFAIEWKVGNFSLDFKLLLNSTLDGIFQEGKNYSSPIYFKAPKPSDTISDIITEMQTSKFSQGSSTLQFVSAASADASGLLRAPIIVHGVYSPDKTQFLWYGNATVILPAPTGPIALQMSAVPPSKTKKVGKVGIGAEVTGGSVSAGAAGSSPSTLWNGELPFSIHRPDILERGISWKGEITQTTLTEAQLDGTFSTTIPSDDGDMYPFSLFQGKFSLQLSLLWNISVDGILSPETTVYSPIYLRGPSAPESAETWFSIDEDPSRSSLFEMNEMEASATLRVPIILEGAYSSDLTTFWWSGRIFLSFPAPSPDTVASNMQKRKEKLSSTKYFPTASSNPPIDNSFVMAGGIKGPPFFRPLRLGVTVRSAHITTSAGSAWSGELPLQLPLPLFDSIAGPGDASASVTGAPVYARGIVWEGRLSTSSPNYLTFSGQFSLPRYIHGGISNFSIQWINGNFEFGLEVLWNTSAISDLNVEGTYSSPVFIGPRQKYSNLRDMPASTLSDVTDAIKLTPSLNVGLALKKVPIILLGMYSADGLSFLWSGNVSVVIPDVVPMPTVSASKYWSDINGAYPPGQMSSMPQRPEIEALPAVPTTSSALGVSVSGGNVTVLANGSYVTWWDGTLPLSIPSSPFNRMVKAASKGGKGDKGKSSSFASGMVWDAVLERQDNITLRLKGNFSLPIFVHGPGALFAIEWKVGNFSLDFKLLWNSTLDGVFQEGKNYSSPIYFKAAKPTDTISYIITEMQNPESMQGSSTLQFVSSATADASVLPRAPIIIHGAYSPDKTQFLWYGNATVILPTSTGTTVLELATEDPKGPTAKAAKVTVGAVALDGMVEGGISGSEYSTLWSGEVPVPIRRPDLLARGVSWQGKLAESSPTEVVINGSFSAMWPTMEDPAFPLAAYEGNFSIKLSLLWNVSLGDVIPADKSIFSPIYLRGSSTPKEAGAWFAEEENNPERMAIELAQKETAPTSLKVPIILQGTYSPDMTTFWWTGRAIFVFPAPSPTTQQVVKKAIGPKGNSVGATVSSGAILTADGSEVWDGSLPFTLPPKLKPVEWNGVLAPSVGGTVELRGGFKGPGGLGEFAFVLTPLWNTPLTGLVTPGVNYTSPLFLREPTDPTPLKEISSPSKTKVPIILQGTFAPDKSSFSWSGNVIVAFP